MPNQVTKYSLLVSCPGDIKDELRIIEECVNRFNALYSDVLGLNRAAANRLRTTVV